MEKMFSSSSVPGLFREGKGKETLRSSRWVPEVDVFEQDDQIIVECECPGMDRENIDVSLKDSVLTITC